ncbi:uncharacterized protein B0H18DRAFT_1088342 [Fomitopsis serialis]|uniref:uncharacterized protein n=1 Tax=Fomitopsis serialis TaxID=139415 RepID=UPI0020087EAA|nr:uncharacterized protein B0H18DRAFT_1088342 [Neoantrodia serialis]KAH9912668.1 hypothetical protein B0H18DRAFT_1088342 [Neoantrodia serialis]
MPRGEPYLGTTRKLVLAIDVGTTYSGVSFCILDPGEVPKVLSVTRFPGQEGENRSRDTKIPSVLYYDENGEVKAIGAEATSDATDSEAEGEQWTRVEWFKLRLRPSGKQARGERLPKIWIDKSVVEIFADYLRYLYRCATDFISESHPLGREVLESGTSIEFVLSHPNGWEGSQQTKMRRAAIMAGLIPDTEAGRARVHFVTEGEASLHFCIVNGLAGDVIKGGNHIMIVDAGGGTIDVSTYKIMATSPMSVVESSATDCVLQGSTFVNVRARALFEAKLEGSRFASEEHFKSMVDCFETKAKPTFRDPSKSAYIKFGASCDFEDKYHIKRGAISLKGDEIAELFRPSIEAIQQAIEDQRDRTKDGITMIMLVGGFASSPFLRSRLQEYARTEGLALFCPETQTSKAVAEGALWFHLDNFVSARIAKHAYGTKASVAFDASLPDHTKRKANTFLSADGRPALAGVFSEIIPLEEEREFCVPLLRKSHFRLKGIQSTILAYKGLKEIHEWIDEEPAMFSTLCTVHAKVSPESFEQAVGKLGEYFMKDYHVVMLFGLTELKAQLSWNENDYCRSPVTLVFNEDEVGAVDDD